MIAIIFTSQRTEIDDKYAEINERLEELAADQAGFIKVRSVRDDSGFGISISYWETEKDARNFKQLQTHLSAQEKGRQDWYEWYEVEIAEIGRSYNFKKDQSA